MISVIIPVFNRPVMAARAIRTAQLQRGAAALNIEIVIVDDGSMPPLQVADHSAHTKIVRLNSNSGPAAARNAGIAASSGDYIAFLDSDDVWLSEKLERQLAILKLIEREEGEKLRALVCGFYYPNRATGLLQARMPRPAACVLDFVSGCWFCPGSALLVRRSAFEIVGPLDERLRRLEDMDWFIRFAQHGGKLHVAPYVGVVVYPSNSASIDAVKASSRIIETKFLSGDHKPLTTRERLRLQAYLALEHAAALHFDGEHFRSLGFLLRSFCYKPRLQTSVDRHWKRSDEVPQDVRDIYRDMTKRE